MNRVRRSRARPCVSAAVGDRGLAGASAAPAAQLDVAFVGADLLDPYYLTMKCGAFAAAKKYNVDLSWQGTDGVDFAPELDDLQRDRAEEAGRDHRRAVQPDRVRQAGRRHDEGRHPVVTVDGSLSKKVELQNIRTDNLKVGGSRRRPASARCSAARGRSPSSRSRRTSRSQRDRVNGFKSVVKKSYPDMKVVSVQYGGADSGKSARVTAALLQRYPDLRASTPPTRTTPTARRRRSSPPASAARSSSSPTTHRRRRSRSSRRASSTASSRSRPTTRATRP